MLLKPKKTLSLFFNAIHFLKFHQMQKFLLVICFITTFSIFSQQSNTDSLTILINKSDNNLEKAKLLLNKISELNKRCLVAIPYLYPQGEHDGNIYETHHQPDLTHELFLNRYSNMNCLFKNELYGYYINY